MTTVIGARRIVTPSGVLDDGWVETDGELIVTVGTESRPLDRDLGDSWLLPGFIDVHMHGGGGHDVTRSASAMAAAVAYHRRFGTTRTLVSLMAQPLEALYEQLGWVAALRDAGLVLGAHLEGPFLASARCGAQDPDSLIAPDPLVLFKLLEAGQGAVRTMTLAPELPGALELIAELRAARVVAAVGHTDATYEQAAVGFGAGATLATHLFNAMGSISQRAPGPSFAALDSGAYVELINDGAHVHTSLVRLAARQAADRLVLITDAISASGVGDGTYTLGDQTVVVRDGQATLAGSDRLAGSTLTMDAAVRRAVLEAGIPIDVASAAASRQPARLLGIDDHYGSVAADRVADLVALDRDLFVRDVMIGGEWL